MRQLLWKTIEGAKLVNGKIVMITGAAAGIGRACAQMFAHQGGRLVLLDINYEGLREVCKLIEIKGGQAIAIEADITQEKDLDHAFQVTNNTYGGLDIVINNVGGGIPTDFFEINLEEWHRVIDLNLTSVFLVSQRAAYLFKKQMRGVIVNISSVAGRSVAPGASCHYTSAKAGVLGLTRHMAKVLVPYNIRVNAVCPGTTNSERIVHRLETQGTLQETIKSIPLGRLGDVDEVASCCLFLASDLSGYVTGAILDENGGSVMV